MTAERLIIETLFRIPDKDGRDVDFLLNPVQAALDAGLRQKNVITKARQRGVSAYFVARYTAKCLAYRNRRALILSHTGPATQRLLDRAHYFLNHIKGPAPDLRFSSRNEITFNKTDSTLYIGTAGSSDIGVGDTITDFHGSEVALWDDPAGLLRGVINSCAPTAEVNLESTGKGQGNFFHRAASRAREGTSDYKLHFFSWPDAPEYSRALSAAEADTFMASLDPTLEEDKLVGVLTPGQLAWRRTKIIEMDYDLAGFKEQYPLTFDECFQGSGGSYFNKINYRPTPDWRPHGSVRHLYVLGDHPKPGLHYVSGLDVGGGTGRDNSAIEVVCLETMEQVAEYANNREEPHIFANTAAPILAMFNQAYTNVERNNHGILTIKQLMDKKDVFHTANLHMSRPPRDMIEEYGRIADYGTYVTVRNRLQVIASARSMVAGELAIHSDMLKDEMNSFVEKENGRIEAQEQCFDDRVLAFAHATYVLPKAIARAGLQAQRDRAAIAKDPFSLDAILAELEGRYDEARPI